MFKNFLTNTINKIRPDEPESYLFNKDGESDPVRVAPNRSPRWQTTTKQYVIIGLSILVVVSLYFLRNMIGPLIFALILTYLNQPFVAYLHRKTRISWKVCVSVTYILMIVIFFGFIAWGGIAFFSQAENLVNFLIESIDNFPDVLNDFLLSDQYVDPLTSQLGDLLNSGFGLQLSDTLQGMLQNVAGGLGSFAQSAVSKLGWLFFIIGTSFFILLESKGIGAIRIKIPIEGYEFDFLMAKQQLSRIWNSFLRGQVILMIFTILLYTIVFSILGLRYSFVLALAVGVARLIPYVGSTVAFCAYAVVAFFQDYSLWGMDQLTYTILIVLIAFVIDKVMDGFLTPKIMADTLKIHPALVLIFAIVCSRLLGFIGILIAAPVVASLKLIFNYIIRKLKDQDPWEGIETISPPVPVSEMFEMYYSKTKKIVSMIFFYIQQKWKALSGQLKKLREKKDSSSAGR